MLRKRGGGGPWTEVLYLFKQRERKALLAGIEWLNSEQALSRGGMKEKATEGGPRGRERERERERRAGHGGRKDTLFYLLFKVMACLTFVLRTDREAAASPPNYNPWAIGSFIPFLKVVNHLRIYIIYSLMLSHNLA